MLRYNLFMTKYFGLISFLILVAGLAFTVFRWKGGLHMTFSQHVARSRSSAIYYSVLFAVSLPLLYVFFANWFVPTFQFSAWFTFIAAMSMTAQFICTLIPEVGGWKTIAHRVITGISGILLLPLIVMIAVSQHVSQDDRLFAWFSLGGMIALLAIALSYQKGYRYSLLLQIGYYALFFAAVFSVAYF